jgi:hypothetical protein
MLLEVWIQAKFLDYVSVKIKIVFIIIIIIII